MRLGHWLTYADRRHWQLYTRWLDVTRWCPGAPCHLPGVRYRRHWLSTHRVRRAGSARERDR